jgi:hypothetical protein
MHASVVGDSDHASGAAEKVQVGGLTAVAGSGCFGEPQAEGSDIGRGGEGRAATLEPAVHRIGEGGRGGECQ